MKMHKMMMFVAAATMLFAAACSKDDNKKDVTEATANTLVIDGKTYQLNSGFHGTDRGYADATTTETDGAGEPKFTIIADVESDTYNQTYDLAEENEGAMLFFNIHDYNHDYTRGPQDFLGTLSITKSESVFSYKVTGKTRQDENISFYISVPASQWGNNER